LQSSKELTGSMVGRGYESGSGGNAKGKEKSADHGDYCTNSIANMMSD
jgi:hypothetical protein